MLNTREEPFLPARPDPLSRLIPTVPDSLRLLRSSNNELYVEKLIFFFRTKATRCHPSSSVGWWCRYEEHMRDLVTFLSEPDVSLRHLWRSFREEMARQLSFCRQCTFAYHKAVREWELSNEVSCWSKGVIRKRVSNLVEWDAFRLTPILRNGVKCALSTDDQYRAASKAQFSAAFLEATLSLRLCMDATFCVVLSELFRAQSTVPTREDFMHFIAELGAIPSGLAALCFHGNDDVRVWAKSLYTTSPPHVQVEDQALQLLISKCLRLAVDKAKAVDESNRSSRTVWAPDLDYIWDGVNILVRRMPSDSLRVMMKKGQKFPILEAVHSSLVLAVRKKCTSGIPPGFSGALMSLECVLMVAPLRSLLECCDLTAEKFLDAVFGCLKLRSLRENERLLLLEMMMDISSSSIKRNDNVFDSRGLFMQCFGALECLRTPKRNDVHQNSESMSRSHDYEEDFCPDMLAKGAPFVVSFYWHFWPKLPLDDHKRLTKFVTAVVRALPDRECAWDLLRTALLTDVCSLLSRIFELQDVQAIFDEFFSFSSTIGKEEKKEATSIRGGVTKMLTSGRVMKQGCLPWMDELWRNVRTGAHVSEESRRSEKVRNFDLRLALDLHRLVGALDIQGCGDLTNDATHGSGSDRTRVGVSDGLISQRMKTVFGTILSRLQQTRQFGAIDISVQHLSLHAGHLLTSSQRKISKDGHLALLDRCEILNATFARPQSRDKLLVHVLKTDQKDRLLVYEGFMSVSRMISAQARAVSARTYTSFCRWYSLLASRDCRLLWDTDALTGAFSVLFYFLETLQSFEAVMTSETFRETICRMFSTVPLIWDSFNDYERVQIRSTQEGSMEEKMRFTETLCPLVRKVGMKLLTSCSTRDKLALDAWVRMVTQDTIRSSLNEVDTSREALRQIIRKNMRGRGPLDFEQCRRLSEAYSLDSLSAFVAEGSVNETRRPALERFKTVTLKPYRGGRTGKCSSVTAHRDNRFGLRTRKTRSTLSILSASARHNGYLHDLRKDHRQARADLRRAAPQHGASLESYEPLKTRFELIREDRIAQKKKEKHDANHEMSMARHFEGNSEDTDGRDCSADSQNGSTERDAPSLVPLERTPPQPVCYPNSCRILRTRSIEQIKRALLVQKDPYCLSTELYTGVAPQTFHDVESYVNYWEPLLIAEFRASIRRRIEEERYLVEQSQEGIRNLGAERIYEVDGPSEDVGYLHALSLSCLNQPTESSLDESDIRGRRSFDFSKEQASDILLLEISEPGEKLHLKAPGKGHEMVTAIVENVVRTRKKSQLSLSLVLEGFAAPGKGRKVRVRKLMSFTTLHRQLDALWALPKAQDGILWSLMDPANAWRKKRDLEAREDHRVDRNSSSPMQIVDKVERLGLLNASQCKAVADVIRSCHCLFASPDRSGKRHYNKNNSGVSLIQGPPGTGKTSTIITLLSALLSGTGSQPHVRSVQMVDGVPVVMAIPTIRILVCAPSNAAVDEIMLRVMGDGLITLSEHRVCPRIVRVGQGTTLRAVQALEVHSIARLARKGPLSSEAGTSPYFPEDQQKLLEVSQQIGKLEVGRRRISAGTEAGSNGKSPKWDSPSACEKFEDINEKLHILQDKKNLLHSALKTKRETRKTEVKSRRQEEMRAVFETLATASVVFATLSSAGHEDLKNLGAGFDVIIIDEAGQSCEPETLIPLTIGQRSGSTNPRFVHTVLVGDPKQLPPTVLSTNRLVVTALGRSLFERIAQVDSSVVHLLDTQYRMHPKISSFPSSRFYEGLLQNSSSVKDKTMRRAWHFDVEKRFGPLTLFDTTNTLTKEVRSQSGSLSNVIEAELVIQGILSMLRLYQERPLQSIVVISPYKQQVHLLKKLIGQHEELENANVEASTIDGIQGREKSVVVLSTVRSGHSRDIGFVKDDRRLNVALTRAKHSLLIFGHAEFLSKHSETWAALVSHCHERSQIVSLSNACDSIFRESESIMESRIPQAVTQVDTLPDINDESTAGVFLTCNSKTGTNAVLHEKRLEKVDVPGQKAVNSARAIEESADFGRAIRGTYNPESQVTKKSSGSNPQTQWGKKYTKEFEIHQEGLQHKGLHGKVVPLGTEGNDACSPPHIMSEDVVITRQSFGEKFSSAAKGLRSSKSPKCATRPIKRHRVEKTGSSLYTKRRVEHSSLLASKQGRSLSRNKNDDSGSLPWSREIQQGESSEINKLVRLPRRVYERSVGTGGTDAKPEQSYTLVPAKRGCIPPDLALLRGTETKLKRARVGSSTTLECDQRQTHAMSSKNQRRMTSTPQAKRRVFQKSTHLQNRRQANERDNRDRVADVDVNPRAHARTHYKNATTTFSLANTRAKLKLTLEAARKARQ